MREGMKEMEAHQEREGVHRPVDSGKMNSHEVVVEELKLKMGDGKSIYLKRWAPREVGEAPVVVQLVHGMAEHIQRYDDFARALVQAGYVVYGNDHRGHGKTVEYTSDLGYFAPKDGWNRLLQDLKEINGHIRSQYPHGKVILFGHSMGSFLSRRFVQLYPGAVDALIISGTGYSKGLVGKIGIAIAAMAKLFTGKKEANRFLDKMAFGTYNRRFKPNRTDFDWLSRDAKAVQAYINDPLCGFVFTSGAFYDLFKGIDVVHQKANMENTPKDLPMYIFSGDQDPVGDYGAGVLKVVETYQKLGIQQLQYQLYPGGRHEMLNETNRQEVYQDILQWIQGLFPEKRGI